MWSLRVVCGPRGVLVASVNVTGHWWTNFLFSLPVSAVFPLERPAGGGAHCLVPTLPEEKRYA